MLRDEVEDEGRVGLLRGVGDEGVFRRSVGRAGEIGRGRDSVGEHVRVHFQI